jgi:transglutaminase-like putative cysteine protease
MRIRAGYELVYECPQPTAMLLALNIHPSRRADLLTEQTLRFSPAVEAREYIDGFGNVCTRIVAPTGQSRVRTRGWMHSTRGLSECDTLQTER